MAASSSRGRAPLGRVEPVISPGTHARMAKRRNLKKEKQERNRAYARKFKKRKLRNDGRGEGAGNGVTGTANNGGAAD